MSGFHFNMFIVLIGSTLLCLLVWVKTLTLNITDHYSDSILSPGLRAVMWWALRYNEQEGSFTWETKWEWDYSMNSHNPPENIPKLPTGAENQPGLFSMLFLEIALNPSRLSIKSSRLQVSPGSVGNTGRCWAQRASRGSVAQTGEAWGDRRADPDTGTGCEEELAWREPRSHRTSHKTCARQRTRGEKETGGMPDWLRPFTQA